MAEHEKIRYFFSNEQVLNRLFVLYGNTTDCYRTASKTLLSFDRMLESHLKHLGYQIVLFYRGGEVLECFDPEMRECLETHFPPTDRKREEEPAETGEETSAAKEDEPAPAPAKKTGIMGMGSFSVRKSTGSAPGGGKKTESRKGAAVRVKEERIPAYLNRIMRQGDMRSCVVCTNCWQICEHAEDKLNKEIATFMSGWYGLPTENSNIGILLFNEPRLGSLGEFLHNKGSWAFLYERIFQDQKPTEAVIHIGAPQMDEIHYQMEAYFTDIRVTDEMEKAALSLVKEKGGKLQVLRKYLYEKNDLPQEETAETLIREYGVGSREDALERIRKTEGWEEVYSLVSRLIDERKAQPESREDYPIQNLTNLRMAYPARQQKHRINLNIMLKGNPGTGKTTVTEWIGLALQQNGVLPIGKVTKVAKQDLEAGYVGQSAIRTQDKINEAMGGVLFVDEAYALFRKEDDGRASFGRDVIDVFVDQMTSHIGELAIVFAGYPEPMDHFMTANPGLMRRFGDNVITIPDYTPDILERIALKSMMPDEKIYDSPDAAGGTRIRRAEYLLAADLVYPEDEPHSSLPVPIGEAISWIQARRKSRGSLGPISLYFDNWYADRDRISFGNAGSALQLAVSICDRARQRTRTAAGRIVITAQDFPEGTEHLFVCRKPSVSEIRKQMEDVVGMQSVKETLYRITNYLQMTTVQNRMRARKANVTAARVEPGHYLFIGNPGTGKTMISEKLALTLSGLGIIEKYQPVRITGLELMNMVGSPNGVDKMAEFIKKCNGGVLVIDEAHQFTNTNLGPIAVKALLDPMIELRESMSFVFCCYPEYVEDFLGIEPGLARRINDIMYFEDYTAEEILEILRIMARRQGYTVSGECEGLILEAIRKMAARDETQNGGTAEKLFKEIKISMSQRISASFEDLDDMNDAFVSGEMDETELYRMHPEDVRQAEQRLTDSERARKAYGRKGKEHPALQNPFQGENAGTL